MNDAEKRGVTTQKLHNWDSRELATADKAILKLAKRIRKICPVCEGRIDGLGHMSGCAVAVAEWREGRRQRG